MLVNEMKTILIACGSFALSSVVVGNAFYQKKQFYPSVVYITKSNPSLAVLYLQAFVFVFLMGKLFRKIFFGQLRAAEMEHLIERSWYAVTETCLAFTVFRDDFSPKFVAAFTLLLFLKCFHWLAEDRVDFMERSPIISFLFHIRVVSLLTFLSLMDSYFVNFAYYSTLTKGASVQMVFGFEYAILLTIVMMTVMKYVLHSIDLQSENPWENKAVYLLYSELVLGFVKVILYIMFMIIMIKIHTFPLFAIRPMYLSVRNFKKALHDVIMSRRAIQQMNTLYPDVSAEELATGDNVCIICREDMVAACKKLPCNHIFHTSCLRSWFQRQQTCPTCRMEVLRMHTVPPPRRPQQQEQAQPGPQVPPQFQHFHQPPPFPMFQQNGQMPPMWPPQMPQAQGQQAQTPTTQTPAAGDSQAPPTSTQATPPSTAPPTFSTQVPPTGTMPGVPGANTLPNLPPFMPGAATQPNMPFMPPMFPYMCMPTNFPRPLRMAGSQASPVNLAALTDEEVRALEGVERENVQARIRWLQDIQSLLDGAVLLIENYNIAAANSNVPGINTLGTNYNLSEGENLTNNSTTSTGETMADTGARPKTPSSKKFTASSTQPREAGSKQEKNNLAADSQVLEGATGFSPPSTDELIPEWHDPRKDEMDEVRRRRLEKFLSDSSTQSENQLPKDDTDDENS